MGWQFWIDRGGTFTDIVAVAPEGAIKTLKLLSEHPERYQDAAVAGIKSILGVELRERIPAGAVDVIKMGTTVATNALLERKGARTLLVVNRGFADLLKIGTQARPRLFDLDIHLPTPLYELVFESAGRVTAQGIEIEPVDAAAAHAAFTRARNDGMQSCAIALIHAWQFPEQERELAALARAAGFERISVSHEVSPLLGLVPRGATTVVDAYLSPVLRRYIEQLAVEVAGTPLLFMQSNGGLVDAAAFQGKDALLSGPAGGIVGAVRTATQAGVTHIIGFDMGGTSTDVALHAGVFERTFDGQVAGVRVRAPMMAIHSVAAGGGSILRFDGARFRVGPESAGADPGPACYGRGEAPTVTDANLVAGRLVAENFLGGAMRLYPARAAKAIAALGRVMRTSAIGAASGVIRVVNANMERAVRVITVERGFDPRDFALMAFGGAGPMHACELALDLGIRHIVLPRNPGLLCAWGALQAPLGREYSLTVRETSPNYRNLAARAAPMLARARRELAAEGARSSQIRVELFADVRYRGQSYEIEVRLTSRFAADFHAAHRRTFGYAALESAVEVVNLRLRATAPGAIAAPERLARSKGRTSPSPVRRIQVITGGRMHGKSARAVPVYAREAIGAGARIRGPAIVVELSATAYVASEFTLRADDFGNLHLEV